MSENRVEKASKIMDELRDSCSQAIFATYGEYLSSGRIDYDMCMKIASGFGGGIASSGNVCGALTGAIMALGIKYGGTKMEKDVTQISTKLLNEFKELNGSVLCGELINHELVTDGLITDEDIQHAFESGAFNNCLKYVADVAKLMEKFIDNQSI